MNWIQSTRDIQKKCNHDNYISSLQDMCKRMQEKKIKRMKEIKYDNKGNEQFTGRYYQILSLGVIIK